MPTTTTHPALQALADLDERKLHDAKVEAARLISTAGDDPEHRALRATSAERRLTEAEHAVNGIHYRGYPMHMVRGRVVGLTDLSEGKARALIAEAEAQGLVVLLGDKQDRRVADAAKYARVEAQRQDMAARRGEAVRRINEAIGGGLVAEYHGAFSISTEALLAIADRCEVAGD